jgi:hypothetical protein
MPALALRQPWAYAVMSLGKDVENRTWRTNYRGLLLIHAGLANDTSAPDLGVDARTLTHGAIIGVVRLVDVVRGASSPWAEPGSWHWIITDPVELPQPVPCRGAVGLWPPPPDAVSSARAALPRVA